MAEFPKRIKNEIIIVLIIFSLSYIFPFCTFYYLGENDAEKIEKPQYINDFRFGYVYIVYISMVFFSVLSSKKNLLKIINILVLIFLFLSFILIKLGFAWWGASPFHPTLSIGFYAINIAIIYFIIRSYSWIKSFITFPIKSKLPLIVAISIPVFLIILIFNLYIKSKNEPIMRSGGISGIVNNRILKEECWDYNEAYDAFATKYYSKPVSDSLKNTFVLDSVRFSFTDNSPNKGKKFTLKAKNGELDIEAFFDRY